LAEDPKAMLMEAAPLAATAKVAMAAPAATVVAAGVRCPQVQLDVAATAVVAMVAPVATAVAAGARCPQMQLDLRTRGQQGRD